MSYLLVCEGHHILCRALGTRRLPGGNCWWVLGPSTWGYSHFGLWTTTVRAEVWSSGLLQKQGAPPKFSLYLPWTISADML